MLAELRMELTSDPAGIGYASYVAAGDHIGLAHLMNLERGGMSVQVDTVTPLVLQEQVDPNEYLALGAPERDLWFSLMIMPVVDLRDPEIRDQLFAVWGPATATRGRILALRHRRGTRAEALFGAGTRITYKAIGQALKGTG